MRIKCNHFDSKNATFTCQTCKHYNHCSLLEPTNSNHSLLLREIQFWKRKLTETKQHLISYETVWEEIKNNKYTTPVNVYGHIEYAPRQNALGVFIRKPEHVIYGWNASRLLNEKERLIEHIRLLNLKELNMRRILQRRQQYGN